MSEQQQQDKKIDIWAWPHEENHMALIVGPPKGSYWRIVTLEEGGEKVFPAFAYNKPLFTQLAEILLKEGAIDQKGLLSAHWDAARRIEFSLVHQDVRKDENGVTFYEKESSVALFIAPSATQKPSVEPGICGVRGQAWPRYVVA